MKLDCVVTACNNNPMYSDFIPMFVKMWKALYPKTDIKIIYIDDVLPNHLQEFKDYIILFPPLEGIDTAFISQYIRLLYPCILEYEGGIMITDMDMMPMNSSYYSKNIENIDNDKFVYYRHVIMEEYKEIAMCYNSALNTTWKEIFNIHSVEDICNRLKEVYSRINYGQPGTLGWTTDQKDLYRIITEWNSRTGRFVYLHDSQTGYRRLDRIYNFRLDDNLVRLIKTGYFSDYHCYRPYAQYKEINDGILNILT